MYLRKNFASINNKFGVFLWSNIMIKVFFIILKKVYDNNIKSDTECKFED